MIWSRMAIFLSILNSEQDKGIRRFAPLGMMEYWGVGLLDKFLGKADCKKRDGFSHFYNF